MEKPMGQRSDVGAYLSTGLCILYTHFTGNRQRPPKYLPAYILERLPKFSLGILHVNFRTLTSIDPDVH